jgi:YidC/Oxa1 family membrane protein insertase
MDKRTLLAVVLSLGVLFVYQTFFVKPPVKTQPAPTQQEATIASQQPAKPPAGVAEKTTGQAAVSTSALAGRQTASKAAVGTEKEVVVETPLYRAVFTTRGAALKSFQLKQYKTALENSEDLVDKFYRWIGRGKPKPEGLSKPIELVHVSEGMPRPLSISFPDSTVNVPEDGFW